MPQTLSQYLKAAAGRIPEEVTAWLGRLVLLYGVPFNYLLPDEAMLPQESIRFFFLDPVWIQYLVQGACSIGNTGYGDTIIDKAMNEQVQPNQPEAAQRPGLADKAAGEVRDRLRQQCEGVSPPPESDCLAWPLTGFLLRSAVVDGWRGLEIMAYRKSAEPEKKTWDSTGMTDAQKLRLDKEGLVPLKALRLEQISRDVMLGIFNGTISRLIIRQPQEGLHFGLRPDPIRRSYTKTLRNLGYKDPTRAGEIFQEHTIDLSRDGLMRDQKHPGVINIGALAARMKAQLSALEELHGDTFTSAEFAVEMIEAPGEFSFIPQSPLSDDEQ